MLWRQNNVTRLLPNLRERMKPVRTLKTLSYLTITAAITIVALFATAVIAQQQPAPQSAPDTLSGKYEGVSKSASGDAPVTLELKREGAKITGRAVSGETVAEISEGTFTDATLTLKFVGSAGSLTAKVDGDKINGDWVSDARKRTVELKKVVAAAAGPINLSGEWEAVADANGQPFPFTLILKIEGEKVTGSSSSQLGESVISSGTWKDGQLNFSLESANGVIAMNAVVIEGKLSGLFDYAGQLQGKWVAVKRK